MPKKKAPKKKRQPEDSDVLASHPPGTIPRSSVLTFQARKPTPDFCWEVGWNGSPINGFQTATLAEIGEGAVSLALDQDTLTLPLKGEVTGQLTVSAPGFEASYDIE